VGSACLRQGLKIVHRSIEAIEIGTALDARHLTLFRELPLGSSFSRLQWECGDGRNQPTQTLQMH
jgi:hypothetical protein